MSMILVVFGVSLFNLSGCYCLVFNLLNPSGYCKKWIILDSTEKDKIKNIEKIYFMVPI